MPLKVSFNCSPTWLSPLPQLHKNKSQVSCSVKVFLEIYLNFQALLDAGASVDTETPSPSSPHFVAVNGENQHWTALTYAASKGHVRCARALLERGANVEGGAIVSEEKITLTPLQVVFHLDCSRKFTLLVMAWFNWKRL